MTARRSVRIVKKIQQDGVWNFVSLARNGTRYIWDPRPGAYYLDWWEGRRRKEYAGETPSGALTAQRRKQHELAGAMVLGDPIPSLLPNSAAEVQAISENNPATGAQAQRTPIDEARKLFLAHIAAHSPDKPETHRRHRQSAGALRTACSGQALRRGRDARRLFSECDEFEQAAFAILLLIGLRKKELYS